MLKVIILNENIAVINPYAPNSIATTIINQTLE